MNHKQLKKELLKNPKFRKEYYNRDLAFNISEKVLSLRIEAGLTQAKLAKKIGTKQESIARLESGKTPPSITFLEKVAKALDMKLVVSFRSK